ncbi:preprotein translocase subunit SecY [Nitrobacteraceae bacterium AZCC 2161]
MVSAAEQLAANLNFSALAKADELKKRIWFTLGALLVCRFGTYIPLPGIDPSIWEEVFRTQQGGILGIFDTFAGGGISRMAIFALNITPYISASIVIQLLTTVLPTLEALKKEGEAGRKTLNQYTRYLTVLLAAFQSYGIAVGLEGAGNAVADPGMFFRISTAITLTGGTMFLMWLGEQITSRGIGNGTSLIILSGIVAELPTAIANTLELGRQGALSTGIILLIVMMAVAVIPFIVFMERAQRRLLIQYPKRQVGNKMFEGQSSHLPLKLNTSGVIPPIFASSLLLLPTTVANFNVGWEWFQWLTTQLGHGRPLFLALYLALIVFFAFFYTAIVFNPTETADNLKKHGGFIPGIRPGERTAEYIDYVLSRITVLGAFYMSIVCLIPEILISYASVPFYFGGTSLLIVVSVTMDTVAHVQGYLLAHQYEGLIKKSKLRGRRIERVKMVGPKAEPSARYVNNHGGASTKEPKIIEPSSLD